MPRWRTSTSPATPSIQSGTTPSPRETRSGYSANYPKAVSGNNLFGIDAQRAEYRSFSKKMRFSYLLALPKRRRVLF
jgi:hypothetical protein